MAQIERDGLKTCDRTPIVIIFADSLLDAGRGPGPKMPGTSYDPGKTYA